MRGLVFCNFLRFGAVLRDEIPNPAFRVAEACEGAEVFLIGKRHRGAFNRFGLFNVGLMAGGFRAIEFDLAVRAVAERFAGGLAAAAKRVLRLRRKFFPFAIIQRIAFFVGDDPLLAQRQVAADEIRAVFGDLNFRMGLRIFFHGELMVARLMKLSRVLRRWCLPQLNSPT